MVTGTNTGGSEVAALQGDRIDFTSYIHPTNGGGGGFRATLRWRANVPP